MILDAQFGTPYPRSAGFDTDKPLPPPAAMWGRMWGSGRGSGSRSGGGGDYERERRVRSNGVRKRRVREWTNRDLSPPSSFRF